MRKHRKKERGKRRRYERSSIVALNRARLVREPLSARLPDWLRKALLGLLAALILTGACALWLTLDECFYVYRPDVKVKGEHRVSPDGIFRASGLEGLHILWMGSSEIEANILEALPSLKEAKVACWPPADCTITVVERQPKVTWESDGQLWWIDAEGAIFPAETRSEDNLLVRGPLPRNEDGRLDEDVGIALNELRAVDAEIPSDLRYVAGRGLVFTDKRGWSVIIGKGAGMDERLQLLEQLAAHLQSRGVRPKFVDVRFPEAPYYSLTNDW